jgi:catechol 2,3-dioxygenase-like lactoylglutathione lyase family enzyme
MNFQGVVINVSDLNRSIDFYRGVLAFTVLNQNDQLATLSAPHSDQPQVVILRAFGSGRLGGARTPGVRAFIVEVDSTDQQEEIAHALDSRGLLVSRRSQSDWTAIVGRDPDGVAVVVASSPGEGRISEASWRTFDELIYGIGE